MPQIPWHHIAHVFLRIIPSLIPSLAIQYTRDCITRCISMRVACVRSRDDMGAICRFGETLDSCVSCPSGGDKSLQLRLPVWLIHNEAGSLDKSLKKLAQKLHQPCYGLAMPQDCSQLHCLDDLAVAYLECIRACQPVGPYVLVGCSVLGSLLAAAMTLHLERYVHLDVR